MVSLRHDQPHSQHRFMSLRSYKMPEQTYCWDDKLGQRKVRNALPIKHQHSSKTPKAEPWDHWNLTSAQHTPCSLGGGVRHVDVLNNLKRLKSFM